MASASSSPVKEPASEGVEADTDEPTCRICFTSGGTEGQQLVSPCKCEGSQKWVHLSCLRRWQRSVQLDLPNHPEDTQREHRHRICNVCRAEFDIPPQDRTSMMSDLACIRPEEIAPGMVLVTKSTAAESAARGAQLNLVLRAYIETKAAHFREAVYMLTEIHAGDGTDGSDAVIGVNLSRTLETFDVSKLEDVADQATINAYKPKGVQVRWMNGGPVKPKTVTAVMCVEHLSCARRAELCARHHLHEVISTPGSQDAVLRGPMSALLAFAAEEVETASQAGARCRAVVLAWAGYAQWSRTQLLGELARGSWGWCQGTPQDVHAAIVALPPSGAGDLWANLRYRSRLRWAPDNELSRDFERQFQRATAEHSDAPDPHAETLDHLVNLFEARRRGSEPRSEPRGSEPRSSSRSRALGAGAARGGRTTCAHQ
mmetsp:Transcript_154016/g.295359  ORF Transcript_154016/g.295359 Transcript_154016/m.295359 type:complete len:430 (+) Transcript_154016:93-1382(+)